MKTLMKSDTEDNDEGFDLAPPPLSGGNYGTRRCTGTQGNTMDVATGIGKQIDTIVALHLNNASETSTQTVIDQFCNDSDLRLLVVLDVYYELLW